MIEGELLQLWKEVPLGTQQTMSQRAEGVDCCLQVFKGIQAFPFFVVFQSFFNFFFFFLKAAKDSMQCS